MSTANSTRPREIELYIARQVRKLADADLLRLLEQLRDLTTTPNREART